MDQEEFILSKISKAGMTWDKLISNGEQYLLSVGDVFRICGGEDKTNIVVYSDLENVNKVEDILVNDTAIILYQTKRNEGHFITINKRGNILEFFDSYGEIEDESLKQALFNLRLHQGKMVSHLKFMAENSGLKIVYNRVQLQRFSSHINTCGRYSALFVRYKDMGMNRFVKLFQGNKENNDFIVTALTIIE